MNKRFRLVTIPFRPFQHLLSSEDQMSCLACVHKHLVDQGKLVVDVFNPSLPHLAGKADITELMGEEPEFLMPDGRRVLRRHNILSRDWFNQVQDLEVLYEVGHPDGHEEDWCTACACGICSASRRSTCSRAVDSRWRRSTRVTTKALTDRSIRESSSLWREESARGLSAVNRRRPTIFAPHWGTAPDAVVVCWILPWAVNCVGARTVTTTRRFCWRPSVELLSEAGISSP